MERKITTIGDDVLREETKAVVTFDSALKELVEDLIETCSVRGGVGIAAPQIGVPLKVFVVFEDFKPRVFINPKVELEGEEIKYDEGCLSVPGIRVTKKRMSKVKVTYDVVESLNGEQTVSTKTEPFGGLTAVAIQHEFDHLNGTLIVDGEEDYICPNCKKVHGNLKSRFCSKDCFLDLRDRSKHKVLK